MSKPLYFDAALLKSNTANGRDWLNLYLHPPNGKGLSYNGWPDRSNNRATHAHYTVTTEAAPYVTGNPLEINTILCLHSPGVFNTLFYAGSMDPTYVNDNQWNAFVINNQLLPGDVARNYGKMRNVARSETIELDATAFNNSGMVYSAQFAPTVYTTTVFDATRRLKQQGRPQDLAHIEEVRKHIRKQHGDALVLRFDEQLRDRTLAPIPESWTNAQIVRLGRPVTQATDVTMLSDQNYVARSTEGLFMVHSCTEDVNSWQAIRNGSYVDGVSNGAQDLMYCYYESTLVVGGMQTSVITAFTTIVGGATLDTPWGDFSWGISHWKNINSSNGGALLNFKAVQSYEASPVVGGFLNAFALPPALYDPAALDSAAVIVQSRMDAMPARFNDQGALAIASGILRGVHDAKDVSAALAPDNGRERQAMQREILEADSESTAQTEDKPGCTLDEYLAKRGKGTPKPAPRKQRQPAKKKTGLAATVAKLAATVSKLTLNGGPAPNGKKIERVIKNATVITHPPRKTRTGRAKPKV